MVDKCPRARHVHIDGVVCKSGGNVRESCCVYIGKAHRCTSKLRDYHWIITKILKDYRIKLRALHSPSSG